MKQQETLEEFIKRQLSLGKYQDQESAIRNSIELTAKWQQERMYSEEDLREAFTQGMENMDYCEMYGWSSKLTEQQWFEHFKKNNNYNEL